MIKAEGLSKTFGKREVLKDLSLEIPANSISVITGKSGSGKSTLLNLLAGLDTPDRGSIEIDQRELTGLSASELAQFRLQNVGIVFQFFNFLPTLTLQQNVAIPGMLRGSARHKLAERVRVCLELVEIG